MRDYAQDMLAVEAAEARGDAEAALAIMSRRPTSPDGSVFWRPWRVHSLQQLAWFADLLPGWVISRWVVDQAYASIKVGADDRVERALALAAAVRSRVARPSTSGEGLCTPGVLDCDWVFRQVYLYELGGLQDFVDHVASTGLLATADRVREWPNAPMGGYRLQNRERDRLTWLDLASGRELTTPNLGAAAFGHDEEYVLARVVPVTGGFILDSTPLSVNADTATAVAADPAQWLDALSRAQASGAPVDTHAPPTGLVLDVPPEVWRCMLADPDPDDDPVTAMAEALQPGALALAVVTLVPHLVELDAAFDPDAPELLELSADVVGVDLWACVAAAVCHPDVLEELAWRAEDERVRSVLGLLGQELAEPAAALCRLVLSMTDPAEPAGGQGAVGVEDGRAAG